MNNNVRGIVIDPGHGGTDPGALGNGLREKDYSLKISKYMADRFSELGIPVVLTREDDITLTPTERVNRVLGAFGSDPNVIVISNHLNAGGGDGAEVIYALRNDGTLANKILESLSDAGQNVRKVYQRRLPSNPSKDYYFMHRNTDPTESVIVEYGFIDSTGDDAKQIVNNWEKYAEAVVKAVADYANIPYVPNEGENIYIVKKGDTLYGIARRFNTDINTLKAVNNLNDNTLSIGQILTIPSISDEIIDNEPSNDDIADNIENVYVVKSGDTLYSISKLYNTTVNRIKELNNLSSNILSIGQELLIPFNSNYDTYQVKSGDTLYSIARRFGTTVDEIKKLNNLVSNLLSISQIIKIPL